MAKDLSYVKLEETKLWKCYRRKMVGVDREKWIKDVYSNSVTQLNAISHTFSNYTLHDETHVINVMEAIARLMGDEIDQLTVGEAELLMLASCLHDMGMVYTTEDKIKWLRRTDKCEEFIRKSNPELMGIRSEDWDNETKQNYYRWLHPFRVNEVLNQPVWAQLFNNRPKDMVSRQTIIGVCQAHGEELTDINLSVLKAKDVDALFCAMMLRIGDLLDFDDSRAPQVLYSYTEKNKRSQEEWDKHIVSAGFTYPASPTTDPLPYAAECYTPEVEHSVRGFLKWVDEELSNCRKLQPRFHERWRSFPMPYEVDKTEIESNGYESGDFELTMDQEQIMTLLTGENLYDSNDVFVRELLQNAIDATLLRGKMDPNFKTDSEEARIDLWEWPDKDGNIWFRIDDRGIGMTKGMLQRYFLRIGKSYYRSAEMKRDLRDHRQDNYQAISRFGIGFLSCFLCGDSAEMSTLYFDSEKNKRENSGKSSMYGYGLRMSITGLTGYYVMQNQASEHFPSQTLPAPNLDYAQLCQNLEMDCYRQEPGTSIAICINPGRLGGANLKEAAKKYLCCPKIRVYYNGERIGETYQEFMTTVRSVAGTRFYELSSDDKEKLKRELQLENYYPKIAVTVAPIDLEEDYVLEGVSGVAVKYEVLWDTSKCPIQSEDISINRHNRCLYVDFTQAIRNRQPSGTNNYAEECTIVIPIDDVTYRLIGYISSKTLSSEIFEGQGLVCAYNGIFAGPIGAANCRGVGDGLAIVFLEGVQQPKVDVGRTKISALNLSSTSAICAWLRGLDIDADLIVGMRFDHSLAEWRALRKTALGSWITDTLNCCFPEIADVGRFLRDKDYALSNGEFISEFGLTVAQVEGEMVISQFVLAHIQDTYDLTIDYLQNQLITPSKKGEQTAIYDLFPVMMFCKAADDDSHQYLCCTNAEHRKGINADHTYARWLLENATKLHTHFNRQFKQIVHALCNKDAGEIVNSLNAIHKQIRSISEKYSIDANSCPQLTMNDFWDRKSNL